MSAPVSKWAQRAYRIVMLALFVIASAIAVIAMAACGGGNATPEEIAAADARATIGPPDCVTHPEVCK